MTSYNREQLEALRIVRTQLATMAQADLDSLSRRTNDYLSFRADLEKFLQDRFGKICTENCFRSRLSACCTREGIIVFFADVVVNALQSTPSQLDAIEKALEKGNESNPSFKCVFLSDRGCLWNIRPIVCAMFLCDPAKEKVFGKDPTAARHWEALEKKRLNFTWPDKPVLFDDLEAVFIEAGYSSPLMHLHFSPGLLRIKKKAGF